MKAVVNWKWTKNGDPLTDVANFTMMFLQPEAVNDRFKYLAGHELLPGMHMTSVHGFTWLAGHIVCSPAILSLIAVHLIEYLECRLAVCKL